MIKFGITIKCTHFSAKQNNKTTENGRENKCSLNTTSLGEEMTWMPVSSNVVNHTPATKISSEIPAELGQPKHKMALCQIADTLNGCLCRSVLNSSLSGVIKCRQADCETQWVSTKCLIWAVLLLTHGACLVSPTMCWTGARAMKLVVYGLQGVQARIWGKVPMAMM